MAEEQINGEMDTQTAITKFLNHSHDGINSRQVNHGNLKSNPSIPTADQLAALAGTSGTPSSTNKYVTNDDTATAATASKVVRRDADGAITVPALPDAASEAASKDYVDDAILYAVASDTNQYRKQTAGTGLDTGEYFQVLIPGKMRIKLYIKATSAPETCSIQEYWGPDGTYGTHELATDTINEEVYAYHTYDVYVRAGSVIKIQAAGCLCEDFQFNFTPTIMTSAYVLDV